MLLRSFGAVVCGALVVVACAGDGSLPPAHPTLVISPASLSLSESQTTATLQLRLQPPGGRLDWHITAMPDWLTVTPKSGTLLGSTATVQVSAPTLATAAPGARSGSIELSSDGGTTSIPVTATVTTANPVLQVAPPSVDIPATSNEGTVTLTNAGQGVAYWQLSSSMAMLPWLSVSPQNSFLEAGQAVELRIAVDKTSLPAGTTTVSLKIVHNVVGPELVVPVSVNVPATSRVRLSTSRLVFGPGVNSRIFHVGNTGGGPLTWDIGTKDDWVSLSPASGVVAAQDSVLVTATVDRAAVPGTDVVGSLALATNAVNGPATMAIEVSSSAPLAAGVRILDHRVVDADFHAATGHLVTVSASPNQISLIDVETGATASVPLAQVPTTVSIGPDGRSAAVGHDGIVSLVDLLTRTVTRTYPISTDALDVVLAGNGFVYVFPQQDQWVPIHAIDLATGAETTRGTIYAGTVGKLHPSGDYIYTASNGLTPSDMAKYDIRHGTPVPLWDSPYHGEYDFGGDFWLVDRGTRVLTRAGNVFRASAVESEDLRFAGQLPGLGLVRFAADSWTLGRVYALGAASGDPASEYSTPTLHVFAAATLNALGTVALPRIPANGTTVAADGFFAFVGGDGTRLYVLERAVPGAGLAQDWALAVLDLATLP
jgi:hypothetical protein